MNPIPDTFATTREALRTLACYVIAPARKALTGRIGLRAADGGFGTAPLDDGTQLLVIGDELHRRPHRSTDITTLSAAAGFADVQLSPDPGVGSDLPPFDPDAELAVDAGASRALGEWYAFGDRLLAPFGETTLWPEHFDLAVAVTLDDLSTANVGASPGDGLDAEPYVYVGPHDMAGLTGEPWNAPFGAVLRHADLRRATDPLATATEFIRNALTALASRRG